MHCGTICMCRMWKVCMFDELLLVNLIVEILLKPCFCSLCCRTHVFMSSGFDPVQEWMLTRIQWHCRFHSFLTRIQNRPGINPVVPNEPLPVLSFSRGLTMYNFHFEPSKSASFIFFMKKNVSTQNWKLFHPVRPVLKHPPVNFPLSFYWCQPNILGHQSGIHGR